MVPVKMKNNSYIVYKFAQNETRRISYPITGDFTEKTRPI
jgi:hypothetical protein